MPLVRRSLAAQLQIHTPANPAGNARDTDRDADTDDY
jgi:hypothetical protein